LGNGGIRIFNIWEGKNVQSWALFGKLKILSQVSLKRIKASGKQRYRLQSIRS